MDPAPYPAGRSAPVIPPVAPLERDRFEHPGLAPATGPIVPAASPGLWGSGAAAAAQAQRGSSLALRLKMTSGICGLKGRDCMEIYELIRIEANLQ